MDETGALLIDTDMGTLRDSPPVSYQLVDGVRVAVESRYVVLTGAAGNRNTASRSVPAIVRITN